MNISDKHFRVIDKGIFLPIARRIAREGIRVSYWTPNEKAFPTLRDCIGDGFPEIKRVNSIWENPNEVDCWVFPDIGFAEEQKELLSQGRLVWGARDGDSIEIMRGKFLEMLIETDLPVPPYIKIVGMDALRNHLKDKKDKWIKISKFRGDWETMHFRTWQESEMELDERSVRLGPWKDLLPFYVFDDIDTQIEDGCDTYSIDGSFPEVIIHGMEAKDKAYLGAFQRYRDLPEEVRKVNEAFKPILQSFRYRSFFSIEVRITKEGQSYCIDPTCRAGSPPSQVMCEMIGNLPEIIYQGSRGVLVEPQQVATFGVQAIVSMKGNPRNVWRTVEIPEELDRWFKPSFACKLDNRIAIAPDPDATANEVGWLVGIGNTIDDAIHHLAGSKALLPDGMHCEFSTLAEVLHEMSEAKSEGIELTKQKVPKPETVLADNKV